MPGAASANWLTMAEPSVAPGEMSEWGKRRAVAYDHGHGDALAERTADGEGEGGGDPRTCAGEDDLADRPASGSRRAPWPPPGPPWPPPRARVRLRATTVGSVMTASTDRGQQDARAVGGSVEEPLQGGDGLEEGLDVVGEQGREHQERPEPDDDARHGGEQLDRRRHRGPASHRGASSERNAAVPRPTGHDDDHGDERRHDRPDEEDAGAVLVGGRVPGARPQKADARMRERLARVDGDADDETGQHGRRKFPPPPSAEPT